MKSFAEEMSFYAAYHQENRNIIIHIFGVPAISFSVLIPLAMVPLFEFAGVMINLAMVFTLAVLTYYFFLDIVFALAATLVYAACLAGAQWVVSLPPAMAWTIAGIFFFGGWAVQFFGHYAFEKKRPALFDNLFQALFSAPIFVVADVFFRLGLRTEIQKKVEELLKERGQLRQAGAA
ncbi:MAG: DUF962 domain-containing protein [Spirochaetales bacterium]|nr:DUF962 domain-containing protein [Spirochaetales bacterium]